MVSILLILAVCVASLAASANAAQGTMMDNLKEKAIAFGEEKLDQYLKKDIQNRETGQAAMSTHPVPAVTALKEHSLDEAFPNSPVTPTAQNNMGNQEDPQARNNLDTQANQEDRQNGGQSRYNEETQGNQEDRQNGGQSRYNEETQGNPQMEASRYAEERQDNQNNQDNMQSRGTDMQQAIPPQNYAAGNANEY